MGDGIYLGRGLHAFMHALLREVAGSDLEAASSVVASLYRCGALEYDKPGYRILNAAVARETVSRWLPEQVQQALPVAAFKAARAHWPVLAAWDEADVALPLDPEAVKRRLKWLLKLQAAGLVSESRAGYCLTIRGRLLLWLHPPEEVGDQTRSLRELALLVMGCRALRNQGRWGDATRVAETLMRHFPATAAAHPEFAIVAALGTLQVGETERSLEALNLLRNGSGWNSRLPLKWKVRLTALEAYIRLELGDLEQAKSLYRAARILARGTSDRIWSALVSAWIGVRTGNYRHTYRLIDAMESLIPDRPRWLDSLLCSWAGNAAYFLERFDEASVRFNAAEQAARESGWRPRVLTMMGNRAANEVDLSHYAEAERILRRLKTQYEQDGLLARLTKTHVDFSRLWSRVGRPDKLVWSATQALYLGGRVHNWHQVSCSHSAIANTARMYMRWDKAEEHYTHAKRFADRVGLSVLSGSADFQLARVAHYRGDTPRALRLLQSARDIFHRQEQYSRLGDVHREAAEFLLESNRLEAAEAELESARAAYDAAGEARERGWVSALSAELKMRRDPRSVTEEDLECIPLEGSGTEDYAFYAHAITALGFALFDDWRSAQHYAKAACAKALVLSDVSLHRHIVELATSLETESAAVRRLGEYWEVALKLPTVRKDVHMTPRKGTKQNVVGGDRWLSARQFSEIAGVVATISDPESLTERILRFVKEQLNADRVALFVGEQQETVDLAGALGADGKEIADIESFSRGVLKSAMERDDVTRIEDAQTDPALSRRASVKRLNVRSVLAAPLIRQGRVIGLLYADTLSVPGAFVEGDHEILKGLARLLAASVEQSQRFRALEHRAAAPRKPGTGRITLTGVVADSRRMQRILRMAIKIARTEKTVIISGEPGTGKEVVADLIQQYSHRAKLPYLKLNCAAVPEANLESELFGVAAGAFTGVMAREGMFELANGGTLFLDEIGEMSPAAQSKLLRVLEESFIRRVGGKRVIAVDVRIIAATNSNLEEAVKKGRFRQDLYDRLNQFAIAIPPLREHREDIPALAVHFLERERERENIADEIEIAPEIIDWLTQSPLRGNARELSNMIGKMVALDMDGVLNWDDLPPDLKAVRQLQSPKFDEDSSFDNMMAIAEATILKRALDNANGRIRKAARDLSMPEATLRRRLKMLDLHLPTMVQMRRKPVRRKARK